MLFKILIIHAIPLYGLIFLGFILGKYMNLDVKAIVTILLYAVLPVVMFGTTGTMRFTTEFFLPPLIIASISILASTLAYFGAGMIWGAEDKRKNLLGLLGVSSNSTYFGVPIALALAGPESIGVYMMMVLPLFILASSLSYYYGARGDYDFKESLIRVAKLPILYGAVLGFAWNAFGFEFSSMMLDYWKYFTGTTIVLGMMMIGVALAKVESFRLDWSFLGGVFVLRYILWPAMGFAWVFIDIYYLKLLDETVHVFIILICSCPLAASAVAFTTKLNLHPKLTACMVLVTTLIAPLFIPVMLTLSSWM